MTRGSPPSDGPSYSKRPVPPSSPSAPPASPSSSPPPAPPPPPYVPTVPPQPNQTSPTTRPPHKTLPPMSSIKSDGEQSTSSVVGESEEGEEQAFLSVSSLERLDEQLNRPRWVVPVLPKQELETLMEACIKMIKAGQDGNDPNFSRFLDSGLKLSFSRLMTDEAVKDWKAEIQRYIFKAADRFLKLFLEKLQRFEEAPVPDVLWTVFGLVLDHRCRFHAHNMHRQPEFFKPMLVSGPTTDRNDNETMTVRTGEVLRVVDGVHEVVQDELQADPAVSPVSLQQSTPVVAADTDRVYAVESKQYGWLADLINRFGERGGFDALKRFLDANVPGATLAQLTLWLRPLGGCALMLKKETIADFALDAIKALAEKLKLVKDEDLKCELVKTDLQENPCLESSKIVRHLLANQPGQVDIVHSMEYFRLRFILRVLQVAPFAGRIQALDEIYGILTSRSSIYSISADAISLDDERLIDWLREHELMDVLLKDNLHQPVFVERLEKVLRALQSKQAIRPSDLDQVWSAQTGKHDVIQRNLHDLFARLTNDLNSEQLEQLFERFKESWRSANVRERTLLLDLIRRLGVDANESGLIEKTLSLLWDLAREPDMPLEQMELALNSMFKILEAPRRNSFRQTYVKKCIDELRNNTNFVVPALKHMQRIFVLAPEAPNNYHISSQQRSMYRHDIISDIQSHEQLCRMLTQNLTTYMEKLREAQTAHPLPPGSDPGDFMLDGRTAHREQLRARLEFLQFVLREGRLWLMMEQAIDLWDSLVVNAVFAYDRNTGFNMFASMQQNDDVDPDSLVQFFETKVLHLEPQLLNDAGLDCFESFFKAVNTKENRLISVRIGQYFLNSTDLKGQDYLWQIILSASEKVSNKAIELFRDIYSSPAADISGHLNELNARIIEESLERLKHMYDAIVVETSDSPAIVDQQKICATKMTRIVKALCAYVRAYDDEFLSVERKRCPLHRASLGRCFRLRVRIPVNSFTNTNHRPMVGPLNQNVVNSPVATQDEIVEVLVHSHQALDRLRREVLLRWQMAVNVAPPPKLDLFDGPRLLDSSDDRKTLVECGISEMSNMVLKLSSATTTTSSPESSIESTPADRSPNNEINAPLEQLLPGVAIANLADGTDFLFKVADLGARLNRTDLRDNARFLLQLIPADQKVVSELRLAAERQELSTLFFGESPTKVLYFLEVAHSLLMPAQSAQECNEFQEMFYRANGLRTCLEMLSSETFMASADVHTRNLANQWMLRMLKFNLAVAGHLNVDHVLRTTRDENERLAANVYRGILEAVPGYHEHLFRQLCEQMAIRLRDGGLSGEQLQFKAKRAELEKLLRLAWTAGSGSTAHTADTPLETISASYDQQWPRDTTLEQISLSAMDALTLAFVACFEANELFEQEMWPRFVIDILFSRMLSVRNQAVESIYVILSKICIGPRKSGALSTAIALLFDNVDKTESRAEIAGSYFHLLCRLLEFSRAQRIEVPLILERLEAHFDWLDKAKQHCIANMESYPVDNLLSGHFDVAKDLIEFLSPEQKFHFGAAQNGRQLVKKLLDEFLLPSSRAFVELNRQSQQPVGNIQRSVTMAASLSHSAASTSSSSTASAAHADQPESSAPIESITTLDGSFTNSSMPRSATTCISPTRCAPVCGSPESVSAAYDTLVALCSDSVENMRAVVAILVEMFYKQVDQSSVEWEFAPVVALRGAGSYVGLKNGGATCYMNSVFQQLFMVESVRHALLNAPGTQADFEGDSDDEVLPLSKSAVTPASRKDYNMSIMRCVQMIFANLLGSQLQFYIPRRFWRRFRFGEQPVNLREQQDALEFFNSVVESVDEGLKSLGESPACERVFGGLFADQKICKDCPHRYQRDEPFTSLSVDIRSHNNLLDSLKEYVKGDLLDNDNAYLCERCNKKVAAIKRLCISKLPACLTIQLKRFDFDWEHEVPVKFNDCFEFPLELDMEPYTVRGLAKQEGESIAEEETGATDMTTSTADEGSSLFRLRGVVVHSGQANGGHYYSFIRSDRGDGKWYKFDDTDVHEHDLSTEDDMRNAWFGGEYITDMFDHITKRYTPRRQKRWWNAYLLFYERITPGQPTTCSSTVAQLSNQMESMSLSSKLRQMLPELEAVVRAKNTRVVHERNEYTPEYFQFIRQLTTTVAAPQFLKNGAIPEQQRKEMALLAVQLLGKFLFTTGLHAKRSLRGNMQDWLNNIVSLFAFSPECRLWFVDSILYGQSRAFSLYLFESTSTEVRHFFVRLLVVLMEKSRDDPADKINQLRHTGESVSDLLIRTLLTLPMTNTNDFHRHPCQYFALFYHYASLGPIEKQQLLKHGVLSQMLKIVLEEHQLTRGMYAEMAKCYQTIGLLIRCCDVSEYCQSSIDGEPLRPNPFAVSKEPAAKMPDEVGNRLFSPGGVERFCRTMLDQSTAGYDVTRSLLQFLCWENIGFTRSAFRSFNWESLFSWNDIKQYLKVLEALLEMQDSWQKDRILFGLRGDGVDKPKPMGILKLMRSNFSFSAKKCYSMLKMITQFLESSSAGQEVLEQNADIREEYVNLSAWLKLELDAAQRHEESYGATSNYGHQAPSSNEAPGVGNSGLERSDSAIDLLAACRRVCKGATGKDRPDRADERRVDSEMHPSRVSSVGGGVGAAPDESDEDEDDDREGPFASVSMEEHRGGPVDALPPPYTDHSTTSFAFSGRVRHSQSASSGLDGGGVADRPPTDSKLPLSRTTDSGLHLTLSTTAPARTIATDVPLPFTSPKSMETRDDLSRTTGGGKL